MSQAKILDTLTEDVNVQNKSRQADRALGPICEYAFLAAVFILPFSKAALECFLAIAFFSWFLSKILSGIPLSPRPRLFLLLGLFVISSSVSAFDSGYPILAARGIVKVLKYTLVMLVAIDLFRDASRMKRLLFVGILSCSGVLMDTGFQRVMGNDLIAKIPLLYSDQQIRVTGPFQSYGLLAALLIAVTPILGALVFTNTKTVIRTASLLLTICALYFLYKTHSRGAWLAAFGSWFVFALMIRKKVMMLALIAMLVAAPFVLPYNALIHLDMNRKEQSVIERLDLWNRAIQVVKKNPWFGCGINTYSKNYINFTNKMSWRVPGYSVHNGYLQTAAETGLVSLFLLMIIISESLVSGYQALRHAQKNRKLLIGGLVSGLMALLLQAGFDTTFHNPQSAVLIWLFMGLLIAVCDIPRIGRI